MWFSGAKYLHTVVEEPGVGVRRGGLGGWLAATWDRPGWGFAWAPGLRAGEEKSGLPTHLPITRTHHPQGLSSRLTPLKTPTKVTPWASCLSFPDR